MKKTIYVAMMMCIFLVVFLYTVPKKYHLDSSSVIDSRLGSISVTDIGLFAEANRERVEKLEWSPCLHVLAVKRSRDMFERDYFSHQDPVTRKIETWDKIAASCGQYIRVGENLVKDFSDYSETHTALMASELHRENILNERFTDMGVGCYENICTELFGDFR